MRLARVTGVDQVGHLASVVGGGLVVRHHHLVHRGSVHGGLTVLSEGGLHVLTSGLAGPGVVVVVTASGLVSAHQLVLVGGVVVVQTVGVGRGTGGRGGHGPVHSDLTNTRHEHLATRAILK